MKKSMQGYFSEPPKMKLGKWGIEGSAPSSYGYKELLFQSGKEKQVFKDWY